jgi:hypothetical protein
MKTFFAGLALGLAIGVLILPRSARPAFDDFHQRTQEFQSGTDRDQRSLHSITLPDSLAMPNAPSRSTLAHPEGRYSSRAIHFHRTSALTSAIHSAELDVRPTTS